MSLLASTDSCTTGTSASGNMCASTDQVPWSRPQLSMSWPTQMGWTISATCAASAGSPAAGYCTANSSSGNPKKSWIVFGIFIAVTAVALMYQCAETARIARGRGNDVANPRQASVYALCSNAFIGVPWPMNAAGIKSVVIDHRLLGVPDSGQSRSAANNGSKRGAADDGRGDQRDAGAIHEVDRVVGLQDNQICSGSGRDDPDVDTPERRCAAGRRCPNRFIDGHVHVPHRKGDAERHRRRVTGARVAVRGQRRPSTGVEQSAGIGIGLACREVGGGEEGCNGVTGRECSDVVVAEVGAMVSGRATELDGQLHSRAMSELIGVQPH